MLSGRSKSLTYLTRRPANIKMVQEEPARTSSAENKKHAVPPSSKNANNTTKSVSDQPIAHSVTKKSDNTDVSSENKQTGDNGKTNNSVDSKYKCTITSERLAQLRKLVDTAMKEHMVFTIKGGWPVIRRELLKRNWIEKVEQGNKVKYTNIEDVTLNLPLKQDWETPSTYINKCERTVMSRMLQSYDVDLYWSMRKETSDLQHRGNAYKLINRFSRSLFASKEGLALLLQQSYWYTEEGVSNVNFPRCYVLGFPDHYNLFVEDYRMTACIGLLRWFVKEYDKDMKHPNQNILSAEGRVPFSALQFALDRCREYVGSQKHVDIDRDINRIWDHEWEQFISHYLMVLHQKELFVEFKEPSLSELYATIKSCLTDISKYWPQYDIDGMKNIWIMKPGNKCRGRGIQLVKSIADVDKIMSLKLKYVVQKYIERPLIIYQTKFDIRQWFMVTNVQPLTIWMYRDSYLRFSSQIFNLENFHESLHLTNHAIQCKYTNVQQRSKALPEDNMWDCHTFKFYLKQIGSDGKWDEVIFPGMKQSIICAMLCSQDTMDRRQNTYEIYGADFIISEDFTPWLLEINCSPDMSSSTAVTSRLCRECMQDVIKVVVDRRRDPNANTGLFDLVYKQNCPKIPPYLGMNLSVRGRRLFRNRNKSHKYIEKKKSDGDAVVAKVSRSKRHFPIKAEYIPDACISKNLPKILSPRIYKGPIIEDLIQELQNSMLSEEIRAGVDFVPAVKPHSAPLVRRKTETLAKTERVQRHRACRRKTNKTTSFCRKASTSEKCKDVDRPKRNYFGLLREWAAKNKISNPECSAEAWESETFSILRGENILIDKRVSIGINKNYYSNSLSSVNSFDLNKLVPLINSSGSAGVRGTGLKE